MEQTKRCLSDVAPQGIWDGRVVADEVVLPEGVGEQVDGEGLDVHAVVDPDEMQLWLLGYDNLSAADELVGEWGDVFAVLLGDEPEVGG